MLHASLILCSQIAWNYSLRRVKIRLQVFQVGRGPQLLNRQDELAEEHGKRAKKNKVRLTREEKTRVRLLRRRFRGRREFQAPRVHVAELFPVAILVFSPCSQRPEVSTIQQFVGALTGSRAGRKKPHWQPGIVCTRADPVSLRANIGCMRTCLPRPFAGISRLPINEACCPVQCIVPGTKKQIHVPALDCEGQIMRCQDHRQVKLGRSKESFFLVTSFYLPTTHYMFPSA